MAIDKQTVVEAVRGRYGAVATSVLAGSNTSCCGPKGSSSRCCGGDLAVIRQR